MKYTIHQIKHGEDEMILNYLEMNEEVARAVAFMRSDEKRIIGFQGKEQVVIKPDDILYLESVDGRTFAYTEQEVYRISYSLSQAEAALGSISFYRCSKAMILNIDCIVSLRSLPSNRIDAVMKNGEHILISRTYASGFRRRLRGEGEER
ncbi:MAG: LytTR family DNA-binding domain-containing protein [Lachnospiraceae bacterium]